VCPGSRAEVVWKGVGSEELAFGQPWRGFAHLRILRHGALMPYSLENTYLRAPAPRCVDATFYREHILLRPHTCASLRILRGCALMRVSSAPAVALRFPCRLGASGHAK
jgi:hypothetical protein